MDGTENRTASSNIRTRRARGTGHVFQHPLTSGWYIAFYHRGQEVRLSAAKLLGKAPQAVTEQDAERALRRKLGEIQGGKYLGPAADRLTVGQLLADYRR